MYCKVKNKIINEVDCIDCSEVDNCSDLITNKREFKIYTSYYKKYDMLFCPRVLPVRISTSQPTWFGYDSYCIKELYPGWDLVSAYKSGQIDDEEYKRIYREKLSKLDRDSILKQLKEFSENNGNCDIALLCYEAPGKLCHRHLVAEWLNCGITELK